MKLLALVLCWGFLAISARAQLGETEKQITDLYGAPSVAYNPGEQGHPTRTLIFQNKSLMRITVQFLDGKCAALTMAHLDRSELSTEEIQSAMTAQSQGMSWKANAMRKSGQVTWVRSDGAMAAYNSMSGFLSFITTRFLRQEGTR